MPASIARRLDPVETAGLRALVRRSMSLTATIQDGEVWLRDEEGQEVHLSVGQTR